MPLFRDLAGDHYNIPPEDLKQYKVGDDLPNDLRITGLEVPPRPSDQKPVGEPRYTWEQRAVRHRDGSAGNESSQMEYVIDGVASDETVQMLFALLPVRSLELRGEDGIATPVYRLVPCCQQSQREQAATAGAGDVGSESCPVAGKRTFGPVRGRTDQPEDRGEATTRHDDERV